MESDLKQFVSILSYLLISICFIFLNIPPNCSCI